MAPGKCLVKTEEALNLWLEDMNGKRVSVDSNVLRQKALSLCEDFGKGSTENSECESFTASNGWLHRFRKRYELKNIKITGEAASADTNAACKTRISSRTSVCDETGLFWKRMSIRTYIHKQSRQKASNPRRTN